MRPTLLKRSNPRALLLLPHPRAAVQRQHTLAATPITSHHVKPEPESWDAFSIRRERPGHADVITIAGNANRIHSELPLDVDNIYRKKIDELALTLDTMGTPEAYWVMRRIPSNVKVVGPKKMEALQKIVERMMQDVLLRIPNAKGMPSPNDLIKRCIAFGLRTGRLYDMVLFHMVSRQENPQNVLAYFIPAVKHRISMFGEAELPPIGPGANPFFVSGTVDGRTLYVAYLYLRMRGFEGRDILAEIDEQLHLLNIPAVDKITNQLPQELGDKLFKLSIELPLEAIVGDGAALYARIRHTIEGNNPEGLTKLYYAARTLHPPTEEFYVMFIRGFRQLWRSESAVRAIWKDMIDAGVKPTEDAYMALIPMARDSDSVTILAEIWKEMLAAGVNPGVRAWTKRVDVAFHRSLGEGMAVLNDMIHKERVQPSSTTINVVVNHFLRYDRHDLARQMMDYATKQGLQPEIAIYNILLKQVLSTRPDRDFDGAVQILKLMEEAKVEPDNVTFTTLVDGIKGYETEISEENTGLFVFEVMKEAGLKPNVWTYGAFLDYLIRLKPRPNTTIRNIFDEMRANRIIPNSTIYDFVIRSAFNSDDIEAVEHYWEEMKRNRIERDARLWENMIFQYALRNDYPRIVKLLKELGNANKSMRSDRGKVVLSLKLYTDVVHHLNVKNSKTEAKDLVKRVVNQWGFRLADLDSAGRPVVRWWKTVRRVGGTTYTLTMLEMADKNAEARGLKPRQFSGTTTHVDEDEDE